MTTVQQTPDALVRAPEEVPDPNLQHTFCGGCYSRENPFINPEFMEAVCGAIVHRSEIPSHETYENACGTCTEAVVTDVRCRKCGSVL